MMAKWSNISNNLSYVRLSLTLWEIVASLPMAQEMSQEFQDLVNRFKVKGSSVTNVAMHMYFPVTMRIPSLETSFSALATGGNLEPGHEVALEVPQEVQGQGHSFNQRLLGS